MIDPRRDPVLEMRLLSGWSALLARIRALTWRGLLAMAGRRDG